MALPSSVGRPRVHSAPYPELEHRHTSHDQLHRPAPTARTWEIGLTTAERRHRFLRPLGPSPDTPRACSTRSPTRRALYIFLAAPHGQLYSRPPLPRGATRRGKLSVAHLSGSRVPGRRLAQLRPEVDRRCRFDGLPRRHFDCGPVQQYQQLFGRAYSGSYARRSLEPHEAERFA